MIDQYKHQPIIPTDWPPRVGQDFFGTLKLLQTQERDADPQTILQKQWFMLRGQVDKIPQVTHCMLMDIQDILKQSDSCQSLRVVVDGPPGIGKTTLCRKLMNMWAKGEIMYGQYHLVLYCPLRNDKVAQARGLQDLLKHAYNCDEVSVVSDWLHRIHGEGLLIMFDGWDELSTDLRVSSLAANIIRKEMLARCSVVVTSRSYASSSLLGICAVNKHVEIIGFSEEDIKAVVKGTLEKKPHLAERLIQDLKVRADVQSLCYVPLFCSMVILVYRKSDGQLPTTLTELYENFILQTIRRHVKLKRTHNIEPRQLHSLHYLPSVLETVLLEICKFAYLGLKEYNPRMTFSSLQQSRSLNMSMKEVYLDLMTMFTIYDEESYQFLHLSIQEFLAAWWIAKYEKTEKVFADCFLIDHFHMCLRFVAGLTGLKDVCYSHYFTKVPPVNVGCIRQPHFGFSAYRHASFYKNKNVYFTFDSNGIDRSHCRDLSNQTEYIDVFTFHLLYESQNQLLCQTFTNSIKSSLCSCRLKPDHLTLFDILCLKFFLCQSNSLWYHLDLRGFRGSQLSLLIDGFSKLTRHDNCKIRILELDLYSRHDPVNLDSLTKLFSSPISHTLKECYITTRTNVLEDLPKYINLLKYLVKAKNLKVVQFGATWFESASKHYLERTEESTFRDLQNQIESSLLDELVIQVITNCNKPGELFYSDFISLINCTIFGVAKSLTIKSLQLFLIDKSSHNYPVISNEAITSLLNSQVLQHLSLSFPDQMLKSLELSEVRAPLTSLNIARQPGQFKRDLPHLVKGLHCLTRYGVINNDEIIQLNITHPYLQVLVVTVDSEDNAGMLFTCLHTNDTLKALRVRFHKDVLDCHDVCNAFETMLCHNQTIKCLEIDHSQFKVISMTYLTHLINGLQHNSGIHELRTPIPLSIADLNVVFSLFIDKRDITDLHLDFKRSDDKIKAVNVKGDIFLDHTIPLLRDMIEKHETLLFLKLSGSTIEEHPKYQYSENSNVQRFWETVLQQTTIKFLIMKPTSILKYNLHLVRKKKDIVTKGASPVIDWIDM